jgi:hypothetical protein
MKSRRKRTKARVPQGNPEVVAESVINSIVKTRIYDKTPLTPDRLQLERWARFLGYFSIRS